LELVQELDKVEGIEIANLIYWAKFIENETIEFVSKSRTFAFHHIPLQSGSNEILTDEGRYQREIYTNG
jgi:tRNA A37 methylthiotransferase MiaB